MILLIEKIEKSKKWNQSILFKFPEKPKNKLSESGRSSRRK